MRPLLGVPPQGVGALPSHPQNLCKPKGISYCQVVKLPVLVSWWFKESVGVKAVTGGAARSRDLRGGEGTVQN